MGYAVRYISQVYNTDDGEIISEEEVYSKAVEYPDSIDELGLRHQEQIELIKNSQDHFLKAQLILIPEKHNCPKCGRETSKAGIFKSDFYDVFTDHRVGIQRFHCTCGWYSKYTVQGLYGSSSHPELTMLQVTRGAENSYRRASNILNEECKKERNINSSSNIMNKVAKVGETLAELKQTTEWSTAEKLCRKLVITTDGGHVQNKEKGKHSFEELVSTVFRPEDLISVSKDRKEIKNKVCVGSAKSDKQHAIKSLTLNACKKLGLNSKTEITALTDGAKNCWSVVKFLLPFCKSLLTVLDWFHIAKHFKSRESKIPEELKGKYEKAKWHLFHGHPSTGIARLQQVKTEAKNSATDEAIDWLINYIQNNTENIVDYHNRKLNGLPFTSQLAETSVNSVINARQKNKKMQWSREGAHNLIQIPVHLYIAKHGQKTGKW